MMQTLPPFKRTQLAHAVAISALITISTPVSAADPNSCPIAGANSITGSVTTTCTLISAGASVTIASPGGAISAASGPGVTASTPLSGTLLAGSITNNGTITGVTDGVFISGTTSLSGITNSGTISGGKGTALNLGNTANAFAVNNTGTISGSINLGINTLNLNGASGQVNGQIFGGTVNVNGALVRTSNNGIYSAPINVNSGGTLGVSAGNITSITGTYNQLAGGTFQTGVASNSSYGKLFSNNGTINLPANAKIDVNVVGSPSLTVGTVLSDVMKTSRENGLVASTFSITDNSALFDFTATKRGDSIDLTIAAASAAPTLTSVNRRGNRAGHGAATVFDSLFSSPGSMGPIITAFGTLGTDQEVSDAVRKTLPLMITGVKQVGLSGLHSIDRIIQSRIQNHHGLSAGDEFLGDRQFWFKPFGTWGDQGDLNGVSGYKTNTYGMVFGADNVLSDKVRVGAAFSYTNSKVDSNSTAAPNTAKIDGYRLIGYGSYSLDPNTDVSLQADLGSSSTRGNRTINFGGVSSADSKYASWNAHVGAGIGHNIVLSEKTTISPSARIDYTFMQDAAYTETGAGVLNLAVAKSKTDELVAYAEGRLTHQLSDSTKFLVNAGAGYDFLAKEGTISSSFVGGGAQFVTKGLDVAPWLARAGIGLVSVSKTMEITARYDVESRERMLNQTVSIKFRMPF